MSPSMCTGWSEDARPSAAGQARSSSLSSCVLYPGSQPFLCLPDLENASSASLLAASLSRAPPPYAVLIRLPDQLIEPPSGIRSMPWAVRLVGSYHHRGPRAERAVLYELESAEP